MILKQVAFVLRLIDDFNGKIIKNQKFTFEIDGITVNPIEKPEGLYVFLEPVKENIELQIMSGYFHKNTIQLEKEKLDEKDPVAEVRLYGKRGYSNNSRFLSGKLEDKNITYPVTVCARSIIDTGLTFKEQCQEEGKTYLILNGFTKEIIVGKTFCITSDKKPEVFVILEKKGINGYRIAEKLSGAYEPGMPISRVYRSVSDKNGYYSIPVTAEEQDKITEVITL